MTESARNYLIVTASYWGFTLVDGALRMLVLFHFFRLGYTPFTLAFLFLLYEAAGIAANLAGGYFASRFGIPRMLAMGQMLQVGGLLMLSALDPGWGAALSVAWVVIAQGIAGVAKDLTKTASKSAIKATSGEGSSQLFRWVAWFTGSKNAMKGIGFFVGGLLLDLAGFTYALWLMATLLGLIFIAGLLTLPKQLGKAKSSKTIRELFGKSRGVNLLAAARIFRSLAARAETMPPARLRLGADEALFSEKGVHRSMGTDVRRDMMPYLATVKEAAIRGDNRAVTVASLETMRLLCEDLSDQAGKQAAFALIDYAQLATEAQLASPAPDWRLIDSAMDHARSRRKYLPADRRFADAFDKLAMAVADRNQTEMRAALPPLRYLFDAYRGRYDSALPDQAITGGRAATAGA